MVGGGGSRFIFDNLAEIEDEFLSSSSIIIVALFETQLFGCCFGIAVGIGGNNVDLVFLIELVSNVGCSSCCWTSPSTLSKNWVDNLLFVSLLNFSNEVNHLFNVSVNFCVTFKEHKKIYFVNTNFATNLN